MVHFPSCEGFATPDPANPMHGRRTARRHIAEAVEYPKCGRLQQPTPLCRNQKCNAPLHATKSSMAGQRLRGLRDASITMLSASRASDSALFVIAGHVARKMREHCRHFRMAAKRAALNALCAAPKMCQIATVEMVTSQMSGAKL
jgi:hypothetical protein